MPEIPRLYRVPATRPLDALPARPLVFEMNIGQADPSVWFVARGHGFTLFLTGAGATAVLPPAWADALWRSRHLDITLREAVPALLVEGDEPLPAWVHYYRGRDAARWRPCVPTFRRVLYRNIRLGVDLVFHGQRGTLEYDLIIHPGGRRAIVAARLPRRRGASRPPRRPRGSFAYPPSQPSLQGGKGSDPGAEFSKETPRAQRRPAPERGGHGLRNLINLVVRRSPLITVPAKGGCTCGSGERPPGPSREERMKRRQE